MSYVGLKHLLAELALAAVQQPGDAGWPPVAAAYAALAADATHRPVRRTELLKRAAALARPPAPAPSNAEIDLLIARGLLAAQDDGSVALTDAFLPYAAYLERQAPRLLDALAELRRPAATAATPAVRIGAALFNARLFFECHEWFEAVWKATTGPRRDLYQGIVQAAAAFYHFEKGNAHGCATLMRKARARLAPYPSHVAGVDLGRFASGLAQWDAHFTGGPRPRAFPTLGLLPRSDRARKE